MSATSRSAQPAASATRAAIAFRSMNGSFQRALCAIGAPAPNARSATVAARGGSRIEAARARLDHPATHRGPRCAAKPADFGPRPVAPRLLRVRREENGMSAQRIAVLSLVLAACTVAPVEKL